MFDKKISAPSDLIGGVAGQAGPDLPTPSRTAFQPHEPLASSLEKRRIVLHAITFVADLVIIAAAFQLASGLYLGLLPSGYSFSQGMMFTPVFSVLAIYNDTYSIRSLTSLRFAIGRVISATVLTTALLIFITFYAERTSDISRALITLGVAIAALGMIVFRWFVHRGLIWRMVPDINSVIVISDGGPGVDLPQARVIDVAEYGLDVRPDDPASLDRFGSMVQNADRVVVSCPAEKRVNWAFILRAAGVEGEVVSYGLNELRPIALRRDGGLTSLVVSSRPLGFRARAIKRVMDLALAGGALIILSPVFLLVALAIRLDDPGPVFFVQRRMGRSNRFFDVIKFRSMKADLLDAHGALSAARDDDRVTRVGRFLRKTSLDEIPQLLNVVRGDMSLVGPRPHALGSLAGAKLFWEVERNYWHRHSLKPGLTGLAQIRGLRGATDEEHHLTARLDADLEYISQWSPWRDLWIMLLTVRVLVHDRAF